MMKKCVAVLVMMLMLVSAAFASEYAPGDEVTVEIGIDGNPNNAMAFEICVQGDEQGLEFLRAAANGNYVAPNANGGNFRGLSVAIGKVGTVTYKVKANAAPGNYRIVVTGQGYTMDGETTGLNVYGSATVTVKGASASCPHTWNDGELTTPPACEATGVKTFTCTACGETRTETVPAVGHTPSADAETVPPTCTEDGRATGECIVCGAKLSATVLPATGHTPGEAETVLPTCTENGHTSIACEACGETLSTEIIPATGHVPGEWVLVQHATGTEPALEEQRCTVCNELLATREIDNPTWYHMTVCSSGPRFSNLGVQTEKWDRFTPVDLSKNGKQVFDLVGGDLHVIGKVYVTVKDGFVTVDYWMLPEIINKGEFMTIFHSIDDVTTLNESELTGYAFGKPISIADDLDGDTKVLLYIHNQAHYRANISGLKILPHKTSDYRKYVEKLMEVMD